MEHQLSMPIDTAVSPSLHPQVIASTEGFENDVALKEAHRAFSVAYESVGAIARARSAAGSNPEWNEAAQLIAVADFAERKQTEATQAFDKAHATLQHHIGMLESALAAPLTTGATLPVDGGLPEAFPR